MTADNIVVFCTEFNLFHSVTAGFFLFQPPSTSSASVPHVLLFVYDESAHITTIECDNRQVLAQVRDDSGARKLQITLRDVMLLRSACTGRVASHIHCITYTYTYIVIFSSVCALQFSIFKQ